MFTFNYDTSNQVPLNMVYVDQAQWLSASETELIFINPLRTTKFPLSDNRHCSLKRDVVYWIIPVKHSNSKWHNINIEINRENADGYVYHGER